MSQYHLIQFLILIIQSLIIPTYTHYSHLHVFSLFIKKLARVSYLDHQAYYFLLTNKYNFHQNNISIEKIKSNEDNVPSVADCYDIRYINDFYSMCKYNRQAEYSRPQFIDTQRHIQRVDNTQLVKVNSTSYSASVTFRNAKHSALSPNDNVILGVKEMDYNANHNYSWMYQVNMDLNVLAVTTTSLQIKLTHVFGDMEQISVSILIISNEFRYKAYMYVFKVIYDNTSYYSNSIGTSFATNTSITVLPFMNSLFISEPATISHKLNFNFFYTTPIISNITYIYSRVKNIYYSNPNRFYTFSDYVAMSLLVVNRLYINQQLFVMDQLTVTEVTGLMSYSTYNPDASQFFMGLTSFVFSPNYADILHGLYWTLTYPSTTSIAFTLDNQIVSFRYLILIINSYGCKNSSYPILGYDGSPNQWKCFDQCYSTLYEYYSIYYLSYVCDQCNNLCVGCYSANQCKKCITGYILQIDGSCYLNTSYYISLSSIYFPNLCSSQHPGCNQCTTYGNKCLTCLFNYYVNYTAMETYYINMSNTTNLQSVNAVYCELCSNKFTNCLTCNNIECLTCQSPNQLITPTLCDMPSTPVVPIIKPCTDIHGCKKCLQTALDDCLQCTNPDLTLVNGKCTSPCGDGIILDSQICDDGNTLPFDGCSSDCMTIENGWQCQYLLNKTSYCQFITSITLNVQSILKTVTQNKLTILLSNSMPYIREWKQFGSKQLKEILRFQVNGFITAFASQLDDFQYSVTFISCAQQTKNRILQDSFDSQSYKFIQLSIDYNNSNLKSLNHQQAKITFSPKLSQIKTFSLTQQFSLSFPLYTDDNHFIQYYPSEYHAQYGTMKFGSMVVGFLMIVILFVSIISCFLDGNNSIQMLLSLETANVVQFTYFSFLGIGQLNPLFIALAEGLRFSNGLDLNVINDQIQNKILLGLDIQSINILNNINISLILPVIFVLMGIIFLIISKVRARKEERKSHLMDCEGRDVLHTQKEKSKQYKLSCLSKILLINLGFGLTVFFLYKYLISILIQSTLGKLQGISYAVITIIGLLVLAFILIMFLKFDIFQKLTQKLSINLSLKDKIIMQDPEHAQHLQNQRSKKKKIYLLVLIFERVINSVILIVFFNSSFKFHGVISIILSVMEIVYISFYNTEIYNPSHKLRLYFNYCISILIQIFLLIRKLLLWNNRDTAGVQESNYGLYLPYTILLLLLLVELNAMVFLIYSIKRIRCCQLEIQWEKIDQQVLDEIKQKVNENLQTANEVSNKKLQNESHQQIEDQQKTPHSIRTRKNTLLMNKRNRKTIHQQLQQQNENEEQDKQIQKQQQQESQRKKDQIIQREMNESDLNDGNISNYSSSYNHNSNRKNSHNQQIALIEQSGNNQFKELNTQQKKVAHHKEIKKELKNLLEEMKIIRPPICKRNKINLQSLSISNDSNLHKRTKKSSSYHYTNQRVYNIYDEYDKI